MEAQTELSAIWVKPNMLTDTCVAIRLVHASVSESIQTIHTEQQQTSKGGETKLYTCSISFYSAVFTRYTCLWMDWKANPVLLPFVCHLFPYHSHARSCSVQTEHILTRAWLCVHIYTQWHFTQREWENQKVTSEEQRFEKPSEGKILYQKTCVPVERKRGVVCAVTVRHTALFCVLQSVCVHVQPYLLSKQIVQKHMLDTVSAYDVSWCISSHFGRLRVVLRAMQCCSVTSNQVPTGHITPGWHCTDFVCTQCVLF